MSEMLAQVPSTTAAATEVATETPAAPTTIAPRVKHGQSIRTETRGADGTLRKTYQTATGPSRAVQAQAAVQAAASTPVATAPASPVAEAISVTEVPAVPVPATPAAPTAQPAAAAVQPTETPEQAESVKAADFTARMARLVKREGKVVDGERALSEARKAFDAERAQHAQALQRVQLLERGRQLAETAPDELLRQVFGIDPQATRQRLLNATIQEVARTPEQKASLLNDQRNQELESIKRRQDQVEQERKKDQERYEQDWQRLQVQSYKDRTIAPLIENFPLFKAEFGDNAVDQVYGHLNAVYQKTRVAPNPKVELEKAEAMLRKKYEKIVPMLGTGASSKQTAATPSKVPAPSAPQAAAQKQATQTPVFRRPERPKSYTSTKRDL